MSTFVINSIDHVKKHVEVTYAIDGKKQNMGDVPLTSEEEMLAFLTSYGLRYAEALKASVPAEAPEVVAEKAKIDALVGQTIALPEQEESKE